MLSKASFITVKQPISVLFPEKILIFPPSVIDSGAFWPLKLIELNFSKKLFRKKLPPAPYR